MLSVFVRREVFDNGHYYSYLNAQIGFRGAIVQLILSNRMLCKLAVSDKCLRLVLYAFFRHEVKYL